MKKKLALFDLDGTLTRKDTMIEFIRYVKGSGRLYLSYFLLSPILILYKLKLYPNDKAKKMLLRFHFKGDSQEYLTKRGESFCSKILPTLFRDLALEKLQFHRSKGHDVFVITASLDLWTKPWLISQNLRYLTTEAEWKDGRFTGEFTTPNCHGEEKVRRLKEVVNPEDYEKIFAYGDSSGDKAMLALADKPFYRRFL